MAKPDPKAEAKTREPAGREARLAKALRENLRRRKGLNASGETPRDRPEQPD
jgi:hypothetical protein